MSSREFLIVFHRDRPDGARQKSIKHFPVRAGALAFKPLITLQERASRSTSDSLIIPSNPIQSRRAQFIVDWNLRCFQGARRSFSNRSLYLVSESSTPCDLDANVRSFTISSSHFIRSGETVTDSFSFSFIESDRIPPDNINTRVTLWDTAGFYPVEGSNNMVDFLSILAQTRLSSSGPASSFTLLTSPKTKEDLFSEGMGQETKKERVRVCNFERVRHNGELGIIEQQGRKDRVEVKRPECGPSTLLLPSIPSERMVRFDGVTV